MGHHRANSARGAQGLCSSCRADDMEKTRRGIVDGYRAGLAPGEIAAHLGISENHVKNEASRMRREGIDIPYAWRTGTKGQAA